MIVRPLVVFLLLLTFTLSFGQTQYGSIRVRVVDSQTSEPLPFVSVYLSQTTIGGYTNDQGDVEINKIPFGTHRLVISEVGHDTYQRSLVVQNEEPQVMTIKLLPKVLEEVKVTAKKDKQWNRLLERFERMFFGPERHKYCKITNPWVLDFKIVNGQFIAEASEPVKIENEYLGYNLEFTMKQCFFSATSFAITGITRFEEKKGDDLTVSKWKANRENTYRGSPQHFFRAAVNNNVKAEGYEIYRDISKKEEITRGFTLASNINFTIEPDSLSGKIKQATNGQYSISVPLRLEIHYLPKRAINTAYTDMGHPITWIEVKNGNLLVSKDGVVQNTEVLTLIGAMSDMRVGDWLPLNYQPSQASANASLVASTPSVVKKDLREKPYVQIDRNYYYIGETIWFKGYMNYSMPVMRDSLSHTVHVELIDPYGPVVKKRYPIEEGVFYGDILLERRLIPGIYQIKAYTSWMLNFEKELIFTKTIQLLDDKEGVKIVSNYQPSTDTTLISIRTDKISYSPKEKITLAIDVKDSSDFRTQANFSIAVTDLDLAVPVKTEKTILTNFALDKKQPGKEVKVKSPIEYGIDFNGRLLVADKPTKGTINAFQRNSTETFDIITDETGKFKKSFAFYDTLEVHLKAASSGSKKGVVVMDTLKIEAPRMQVDPLKLDTYTSNNIKHSAAPLLVDGTALKAVEVPGKKIEKTTSTPTNTIYGRPDYTVDGDWIRERNYIDIFQALSGRVPGLNYDQALMMVRFGSTQYSSFAGGGGAGSPLIIVDGVPMNESQVISSVPIKSIDRVDILKYSATATFGTRGGNGVIVIYTKSGVLPSVEKEAFDKKKFQVVKWMGYNFPSKFSPIPGGATIFWAPSITTDGKEPAVISFDASDAVTKYRIVVEGVTISGTPVRAEKIIEIVKGH